MDTRTAIQVLNGMDVGIVVDNFFLTITDVVVLVVRLGSIFLAVVKKLIDNISLDNSSLVVIMA